jgi:hypothetical protein
MITPITKINENDKKKLKNHLVKPSAEDEEIFSIKGAIPPLNAGNAKMKTIIKIIEIIKVSKFIF